MSTRYFALALALFGCSGNAFSVSVTNGRAQEADADAGALAPSEDSSDPLLSDARGAPESDSSARSESGSDSGPMVPGEDSGAPRAPDAAPSGTGGASALGSGGASGAGSQAGTGGAPPPPPPKEACADRSPALCPVDPSCQGRAPCCTLYGSKFVCACVGTDGVCR